MFANPDEEVPVLIRFQVWFFLSIMPRSTIQSASSYQVHVTTAAHQCQSLPLSHKIVLAELLLGVDEVHDTGVGGIHLLQKTFRRVGVEGSGFLHGHKAKPQTVHRPFRAK